MVLVQTFEDRGEVQAVLLQKWLFDEGVEVEVDGSTEDKRKSVYAVRMSGLTRGLNVEEFLRRS